MFSHLHLNNKANNACPSSTICMEGFFSNNKKLNVLPGQGIGDNYVISSLAIRGVISGWNWVTRLALFGTTELFLNIQRDMDVSQLNDKQRDALGKVIDLIMLFDDQHTVGSSAPDSVGVMRMTEFYCMWLADARGSQGLSDERFQRRFSTQMADSTKLWSCAGRENAQNCKSFNEFCVT